MISIIQKKGKIYITADCAGEEEITREQMLEHFTLKRVNKAPASFDPQKLMAFQAKWSAQIPVAQKVSQCAPFLVAAQYVPENPSAEDLAKVEQVIEAAGDRIKISGDILQFDEFFTADDQLAYDESAFDKRLRQDAADVERLT